MRSRSIGVAVIGLTLAVAACGSSSKSSSSASGTTAKASSATSAASNSATSARGAATSAAGSTAPVDTNFSGKGSKAFCDLARQYADQAQKQASAANNPNGLKDTFTQLDQIMPKLQSTAPSEIKADVQTVADEFKKVEAIFKQYDWDFTKLVTAAQKDPTLLQSMQFENDPNFAAAGQRLDAYGKKVCGFTDSSTTG
jgi:hypothetical protein